MVQIRYAISIILVLNFLQPSKSYINNTYYERTAAECLKITIRHLFPQNCSLVFLIGNYNAVMTSDVSKNPYIYFYLHENFIKIYQFHQKHFIFFVDSISEIQLAVHKMKNIHIWHSGISSYGKFLIFLSTERINVPNIFEQLWELDMTQIVLVIYEMDTKVFTIASSSRYFEQNQCGKKAKKILYTPCTDILYSKFYPIPNKLSYCSLKVLAMDRLFNYPFIYKNSENITTGLLIRPLHFIQDILNLSLVFLSDNDIGIQKKFIETQSSNLFNQLLDNRTVDVLCATPARNLKEYDYYCHTDIYFHDNYIWVAPKPGKMSNIKILATIYQAKTWIILSCVFILVTCVWSLRGSLKRGKLTAIDNFFDIIKITLGQPISKTDLFLGRRHLIIFYLIYSCEINWHFQCKLNSILTSPIYEKGLKSVEELINSKLTPWVLDNIREGLLFTNTSLSNDLYRKSQLRPHGIQETEALAFLIKNRNISTHILMVYLSTLPTYKDQVDLLGSDFLTILESSYATRLGNPIRHKMNKAIGKILSGGFDKKFVLDVQKVNFVKTVDDKVMLTLGHTQGAFLILGLGLVAAGFIFILELCGRFLLLII